MKERVGKPTESPETLDDKILRLFPGKTVRKDLTKKLKEGANVPVYVLEFLLGKYCGTKDEALIEAGVRKIKQILSQNYIRPDESQKALALLRKNGTFTVIDHVTVRLNIRKNEYAADLSSMGLTELPIEDKYPESYERLLCGGIWCLAELSYTFSAGSKAPIRVKSLAPIQMPHIDIEEYQKRRACLDKTEWMDVLMRSIGMEPEELTERQKWLLLLRLVPLAENNYNLCELGPRSTGKSHIYKEVSPNSILVSGGQTTVANLFYHMGQRTVGLVGLWDCVAFDEVAGIRFHDRDGIQIMKDYMASGSFARGKEAKMGRASIAFVGNTNREVKDMLADSTLFEPFPREMGTDTAFLDRMHAYIPGWEIPKFFPRHFTNHYGLIADYLAEILRELRRFNYSDAVDRYFALGPALNQRDTIAVRKTVDGLLKLMYPHGEFTKDELEEVLRLALEMRRRVKEQLFRLGGREFQDIQLSYIDLETKKETVVDLPENQL